MLISQALLAQQQGNGNSVFDLRLDAEQQAQYDAIVAQYGAGSLYVGLVASLGCEVAALGCGPATSGAESFLAFDASPTAGWSSAVWESSP